MKRYIHARLDPAARAALDALKRKTGRRESDLVRRGLQLVEKELRGQVSALDLAHRSAGKFRGGPRDLTTNPGHLDRYGK
jgi:hypothetical protein